MDGMDSAERPSVPVAVAAVLGLLAVAELALRLASGSTVRAGLAAAPVTHAGASLPTALLMCAFCLLATVPAGLLRPVPAAVTVWVAAMLSLVLFELVTVAGAVALLLVAYRLARRGMDPRGRAGRAVPRDRAGPGGHRGPGGAAGRERGGPGHTQPDFTVLGTASDGSEAVRVCRELQPDVVLMDVRMPGLDGIEATRQLVDAGGPGPRVLILTTFDLDEYVFDALRAGASGFLLKDVTAERLFDAVRVVAAGEALLAPAITRRLISEFTRLRPASDALPSAGVGALTPRETEVLRLVAEGLSNPEVAQRLVVTEETVKTHVSRILAKLGLRDRTQAVVAAYESGLVVPGRERG
jgi:DNA-binding NarL/FixJ family response regulator